MPSRSRPPTWQRRFRFIQRLGSRCRLVVTTPCSRPCQSNQTVLTSTSSLDQRTTPLTQLGDASSFTSMMSTNSITKQSQQASLLRLSQLTHRGVSDISRSLTPLATTSALQNHSIQSHSNRISQDGWQVGHHHTRRFASSVDMTGVAHLRHGCPARLYT